MFPKTGNTFQNDSSKLNSQLEYREAIWSALTNELGRTHQAAKTTMRWTGLARGPQETGFQLRMLRQANT